MPANATRRSPARNKRPHSDANVGRLPVKRAEGYVLRAPSTIRPSRALTTNQRAWLDAIAASVKREMQEESIRRHVRQRGSKN